MLWKFNTSESVVAPVSIGEKTCYVGGKNGILYAFGDTQLPYVKITYPDNNSILQTGNIQINWTGGDNDSGLDHYEYSVDNGLWENIGNSTNITLNLADGHHIFFIKAVDRMNNTAMDSVSFLVDTEAPTVTILTPLNGSFINSPNVTVEWNGTDKGSGIKNYSIKLDTGLWIEKDKDRNHTFYNLSQGWHNVTIKATDNTNKSSVKNLTFMIDLTLPYVNITIPNNNTIFTGNTVEVNWTGADNESGLNHYEIRMGTGRWRNVGMAESHTFKRLSEGEHIAYVKAVDNASNYKVVSVHFIVDLSSPKISITYPLDGMGANTTDVNVTWVGSDAGVGIDYYKIRIDNGTWIFVGQNTSYIFHSLEEGSTHKIDVFAADKIGRNSTDSSTFTVDLSSPMINITSPQNGEIIPSNSVSLEWEGYDKYTGINEYYVRIDGGNWSSVGKNTGYIFQNVEDGMHRAEVKAIDEANNENTTFVDFVVDTTQPTVNLIQPVPYSVYTNSSVYVEWKGNDSTSGLDHYEIKMKGGNWRDIGLQTNITLTGLSEGDYVINIKAVDKAGWWAKDSSIFTVKHKDTVPPSIQITSPIENDFINNRTVILKWTGSDDYSGIDHYEVKIDNEDWIDVGNNITYEILGLSNGNHTAIVKAVDGSGNENTDTVNFTVDLILPEVSILYPLTNTYLNSNEITVKWTGYDNISGIKEYYIGLDDDSWILVGNNTSFTFKNLSDKIYKISIKAVDNAMNYNETNISVTVDTKNPRVLSTVPYDGETDVNVSDNLRIVFSEPINSTSFVYSCSPDPAGWILSWVSNNTTLLLSHHPFDFNTTYNLTISSARDFAGNNLLNRPITIEFSTISIENNTSLPRVLSTVPYDGETDVNVSDNLRIVFSEPINSTSFVYSCSPDPAGWILSWVSNNTTLLLSHHPFDFNTTYNLTISSARDFAGNNLEKKYTILFTTEKEERNMPKKNATITGRVVDINGNPVLGAQIIIDDELKAITDTNGSFFIETSPGNHTLTITKDGYQEKRVSLYLGSGEKKNLGEISLPKTHTQKIQNGLISINYLLIIILIIAASSILVYIIFKKNRHGSTETRDAHKEDDENREHF